MTTPVVAKNLRKAYGRVEAVKEVSFEVRENEIFGLIGPNGAGKSTVLKILATLLSPSSGEVKIFDCDLVKQSNRIRQLISYLPEEAGAYKNMTGTNYLKFMANLFVGPSDNISDTVKRAEKIANLGVRIRDKIGTYSKGMTRKLLLARTVMTKPALAIMDEPTSGLDVMNALEVRNQIKELSRQGMSVLLSSHNMLEVEFLSDRVAIISEGIIRETGTPSELKKRYHSSNLEEVFVEITKGGKR